MSLDKLSKNQLISLLDNHRAEIMELRKQLSDKTPKKSSDEEHSEYDKEAHTYYRIGKTNRAIYVVINYSSSTGEAMVLSSKEMPIHAADYKCKHELVTNGRAFK